MDATGIAPTARTHRACARAPYVRAGGAIGTPALLLRSGVPDPHGVAGQAHVPASDRRVGAR